LRVYTGERLALEFRAKLFEHVQRLSLAYHDTRGTSEAIYRIQYDALAIQKIAVDAMTPLVTALFTVLGMIVVTASIDWQLALGAATVLFVGVAHVRSGQLTLGSLLLVMTYLTQLYEPLETASAKTASLQSSMANAERAFELLDEPVDVPERPGARPVARARGAVAFRGVWFPDVPGRPALQNVTFEATPGSHIAIAGTTGAGKTTLVSLLMRFYDPAAGRIELDGVDLRELRLADLR